MHGWDKSPKTFKTGLCFNKMSALIAPYFIQRYIYALQSPVNGKYCYIISLIGVKFT